jgi:hypothetical protein
VIEDLDICVTKIRKRHFGTFFSFSGPVECEASVDPTQLNLPVRICFGRVIVSDNPIIDGKPQTKGTD